MRELAIVLGLIKQGDEYILQFRDGDPSIGAANLIGCFGGKIEPGETDAEAVCRELSEETTLQLTVDGIKKLGSVVVISDYKLEEVKVIAEVFLAIVGEAEVSALEGKLVRITEKDISKNLAEMTPGTSAAFEKFVLNKG